MCAGIQHYVHEKRATLSFQDAIDIYKDPKFIYFRSVFDLHQQRIGNCKKQVNIISGDIFYLQPLHHHKNEMH